MHVIPRSQCGKSKLKLFVCENIFAHNINSYLLLQFLSKNIGIDKKS